MSIEIEKILTKEQLKNLSKDSIKSINESLNKVYNAKVEQLDKETSDKFNSLVEGMSKKFEEDVNTAIVESVKSNVKEIQTGKFYNIIQGMVNLLENAGITTTEKTKELSEKLGDANKKLEEAFKVREEIKNELEESNKENYILASLKGMKPEVINSALDYFKDKDMLDVQDGLQTFVDGDFSDLDLSSEGTKELVGELDLEQVNDALDEIEVDKADNEKKVSLHESAEQKKTKATFESLGKGLRQQRVSKSPNVTNDQLKESETIMENEEGGDVESDTKEAMDKIDKFSDLGYNFK